MRRLFIVTYTVVTVTGYGFTMRGGSFPMATATRESALAEGRKRAIEEEGKEATDVQVVDVLDILVNSANLCSRLSAWCAAVGALGGEQ